MQITLTKIRGFSGCIVTLIRRTCILLLYDWTALIVMALGITSISLAPSTACGSVSPLVQTAVHEGRAGRISGFAP